MALQNPVTEHSGIVDVSAIQLCTRAYEPARDNSPGRRSQFCLHSLTAPKIYAPTCTPPRGDISQESFALPDNLYNVVPGFSTASSSAGL